MSCIDVIEKLHVGPGDLIIVKTNSEAAMVHALNRIREKGFEHRVIVMPAGSSIDKISLEEAKRILKRISEP